MIRVFMTLVLCGACSSSNETLPLQPSLPPHQQSLPHLGGIWPKRKWPFSKWTLGRDIAQIEAGPGRLYIRARDFKDVIALCENKSSRRLQRPLTLWVNDYSLVGAVCVSSYVTHLWVEGKPEREDYLSEFANLEGLRIDYAGLPPALDANRKALASLVALSVGEPDHLASYWPTLTRVRHLQVNSQAAKRDVLKGLAPRSNMVTLAAKGPSLRLWPRQPNLLSLQPGWVEDLNDISKLLSPSLLELDLRGNLSQADVARIAELPRLRNLSLVYAPPLDYQVLARMRSMERLRLIANGGSGPRQTVSLKPLANLTRLRELFLYGVNVRDEFDGLAAVPLTSLSISGENLAEAKSSFWRTAPLKKLDIDVNDAGMAQLAQLPLLEKLAIAGPVTDEGIKALAAHPTLTTLDLQYTKVTAVGLKTLLALPRLESVLAPETIAEEEVSAFETQLEKRQSR